MRTVAAAILIVILGQALALPALEATCALGECANETQSECLTQCSDCLCCSPVRTVPPLIVVLQPTSVVTASVVVDRDTVPPDYPPHEILHVPKA